MPTLFADSCRKTLSIRLLLIALLAGTASYCLADPASARTERKPMIIGGIMSLPTPPYIWIDPCDNEPTGASILLLTKAMQELNVEFRFAPPTAMNFEGIMLRRKKLSNGDYDALIAAQRSNNPENIIYSTYPIITLQDAILFRKQEGLVINGISDVAHLKGVIAAIDEGAIDSPIARWMNTQGLNFTIKATRKEAIDAVVNGDADYMIIERYRAVATFMDDENRKWLDLIPIKDNIRELYFAMNKNSPWRDLMPQLDNILQRFEQSGRAEMLRYSYLRSWLRLGDCSIQ